MNVIVLTSVHANSFVEFIPLQLLMWCECSAGGQLGVCDRKSKYYIPHTCTCSLCVFIFHSVCAQGQCLCISTATNTRGYSSAMYPFVGLLQPDPPCSTCYLCSTEDECHTHVV